MVEVVKYKKNNCLCIITLVYLLHDFLRHSYFLSIFVRLQPKTLGAGGILFSGVSICE